MENVEGVQSRKQISQILGEERDSLYVKEIIWQCNNATFIEKNKQCENATRTQKQKIISKGTQILKFKDQDRR
jgi:hypothetical protein